MEMGMSATVSTYITKNKLQATNGSHEHGWRNTMVAVGKHHLINLLTKKYSSGAFPAGRPWWQPMCQP
jgi:hypothetical protein